MNTHNICFYGDLEKIIPEISSNTPPYQVLSSVTITRLISQSICLHEKKKKKKTTTNKTQIRTIRTLKHKTFWALLRPRQIKCKYIYMVPTDYQKWWWFGVQQLRYSLAESTDNKCIFLLYFSQKTGFDISLEDNLHDCHALNSGKSKKKYFKMLC